MHLSHQHAASPCVTLFVTQRLLVHSICHISMLLYHVGVLVVCWLLVCMHMGPLHYAREHVALPAVAKYDDFT